MFDANSLDWSWCSECTMSTLRATHGLVPPVSRCPAHPHGGWSMGQPRLSACAMPSPPGPWHSLKTHHHHPQSSQSLGLCKLIVQSYLSGNSLCESSQESGLYLSQWALALKSQSFSACQKKQTKAPSLTRALYKLQQLFHFNFAHEESCIVEQGGDNLCQKLFKSYFESIFHLQILSGLSNLW